MLSQSVPKMETKSVKTQTINNTSAIHTFYFTSMSSTSKTNVAFGGITPPAPAEP